MPVSKSWTCTRPREIHACRQPCGTLLPVRKDLPLWFDWRHRRTSSIKAGRRLDYDTALTRVFRQSLPQTAWTCRVAIPRPAGERGGKRRSWPRIPSQRFLSWHFLPGAGHGASVELPPFVGQPRSCLDTVRCLWAAAAHLPPSSRQSGWRGSVTNWARWAFLRLPRRVCVQGHIPREQPPRVNGSNKGHPPLSTKSVHCLFLG